MSNADPDRESKPGSNSDDTTGVTLALALFAILAALEYVIMRNGYSIGIRQPGDTPGNITAILIPILGFCQIVLLIKIAAGWGKRSVAMLLAFLILISAIQLGASHYASWVHGINSGAAKLSQYRNNMRAISFDLESYRVTNNAYPPNLSPLKLPITTRALMENTFGRIQYATAGGKYMLWASGPDAKQDIQDGPELQAAIAEAEPTEWLINHTYDPTNGGGAPGDIIRLGPR